jgi:NTE family protein
LNPKPLILILLIFFLSNPFFGQKVGLVLSGGGAYGYAHIGVLKALEENNIPIDYITGTSAGALVGGMYAAGLPPKMIDSLVQTPKYLLMATGGIEPEFEHFFRKESLDANWIKIRLTQDFSLTKIIPTNFTNPILVDFEGMTKYAPISAAAQYNFDSLFVPFRCIAADISSKKSVVFKSGDLYQSVRASMTFPGYLKPIKVNGKLMFDGGLYNNFPTDVMYDEFFPDIIIGVNFSDTASPPDPDDVFSQLRAMIINRNPSSIICENGILLEPKLDISLFAFDRADEAIQAGYEATMNIMDSIKSIIHARSNPTDLMKRRYQFHKKAIPLVFDNIVVKGASPYIQSFIRKSLMYKDDSVDEATMKKRYFRLIADNKIKFMYPIAVFNPSTGKFTLELEVQLERPFAVSFGGVFSSSPINTAFLGVEYFNLRKIGLSAEVNSYFGKYYGSILGSVKFDFNYKYPFSLRAYGINNRWDYFKSFATFFEEAKPSFIIENEQFAGLDLILPVSTFGKLTVGGAYGELDNNYYQTANFSPSDTADLTTLTGTVASILYEQSTLNRKQYASEGFGLSISGKYFNGLENSTPGSTSALSLPAENILQTWWIGKISAQKYFKINRTFQLGFSTEIAAIYTNKFLDNYTATTIISHSFQPIPESKTFFISNHSTFNYGALGLQSVMKLSTNIDFRLEGYYFRPYFAVKSNSFNQAYYEDGLGESSIIGSGSFVYHSPLGPVSAGVNYYTARENPYSFIINFGYILFNKRFLK